VTRARKHFEDLGVDGRIILKWIFKKLVWMMDGLDCSASGYGQVAGACECCNEPSGSINRREFL